MPLTSVHRMFANAYDDAGNLNLSVLRSSWNLNSSVIERLMTLQVL